MIMKKEIYIRKYYAGFGDRVTEAYYEENGEFFQHTYTSGYWSGKENTQKVSKDKIEKAIRIEQDQLIKELGILNNKLENLKNL